MNKKTFLLLLMLLIVPAALAKSGSMKLLAVSNPDSNATGSVANLFLEIKEGTGRVFIDSYPLSRLDTQISTRFAKEVACNFLDVDCGDFDFFYTIRADSALVGGPSAGAATTILTISVLEDTTIDQSASITGTINTGGIIGPVGGILPKLDAAKAAGIKKVVIPKYSEVNTTNYTEYEQQYGIRIVEVSQLEEAMQEFTGKNYSTNGNVQISESYLDTMRGISEEMCTRASGLVAESAEPDMNASSRSLLDKGETALADGHYYSAASYCFGSTLSSRYSLLLQENMAETRLREKILETQESAQEFKEAIRKKPMITVIDLETYMAVSDRISDAEESLDESIQMLQLNSTNASIYRLAYAMERLNSARSWSVFFGKPGREFILDKNALEESCLKKISEVEERIQYVDLYLPLATRDARAAVAESYENYNDGSPELCLYEASIAKASVDLILNSMSIDESFTQEVIADRLAVVKSLIAKQSSRGIFPIMAYSYYEYADSLKETDEYSALLYLEYAVELGSLDIYFEKRKLELPELSINPYLAFFIGISLGVVLGIASGALASRRSRENPAGRPRKRQSL
jgi:uncharacterized protein